MEHVAFVPIRAGSKGFPGKNEILLDGTLNFVSEMGMTVVISTDIKRVLRDYSSRYHVIERPSYLCGDETSIKEVLLEYSVDHCSNDNPKWIWLFYVTFASRDLPFFKAAMDLVKNDASPPSYIGIQAPKTHPYDCWSRSQTGELVRLFEGDWYRRQDKIEVWEHSHYVSVVNSSRIDELNSELIGHSSKSIQIPLEISSRVIEIDTPEDYKLHNQLSGT